LLKKCRRRKGKKNTGLTTGDLRGTELPHRDGEKSTWGTGKERLKSCGKQKHSVTPGACMVKTAERGAHGCRYKKLKRRPCQGGVEGGGGNRQNPNKESAGKGRGGGRVGRVIQAPTVDCAIKRRQIRIYSQPTRPQGSGEKDTKKKGRVEIEKWVFLKKVDSKEEIKYTLGYIKRKTRSGLDLTSQKSRPARGQVEGTRGMVRRRNYKRGGGGKGGAGGGAGGRKKLTK